jgi:transcriptional regulator with XRE-family HTH domain
VDPLYREFGRLVKSGREALGMSQAELGGRIGLSRTSVTNIESGRQHVSLRQLIEIAQAIGRTPASLLPEAVVALPQGIRAEIRRKGYREDVSDLIEHVWAASSRQRGDSEAQRL